MKEFEQKAKEKTKELVEKFEKEWKPVMEALQEATEVFDNLDGMQGVNCHSYLIILVILV